MKKPSSIDIAVGTGARATTTTALIYRAERRASAALILGHGAGAGQQSPFMVDFARALSELGLDVLTFNFLYTEQKRKVPDRGPLLEECYRAVIDGAREHLESARRALFIGGKSMGGRIATQVAALDATLPIEGLVLLGYPLHPPGQPHKLRDAHLLVVRRPMLFVQGTRDTFGTPDELAPILARLTPRPIVHVVEGGDHSFKIGRGGKAAQESVYEDVQRTIVGWIEAVMRAAPGTPQPRD